jgi:zinc/manganese transport system substrate-binding protein
VRAIGAENEYANVISQVGGRYVQVSAVMGNPDVDPHDFEASARLASEVSQAQLVVQNGLGYDGFMNKLEAAASPPGQRVVVVADLVHPRPGTFNPHLWYSPATMPLVAGAVARELTRLQPSHGAYFEERARAFDASLAPWHKALAAFAKAYPGTPVAVTEPVADFMLAAARARVLTPRPLQTAVMDGIDPSPQDVAAQDSLLAHHRVKVLLYNVQVTDPVTAGFLATARRAGVPVVGVYETMPAPGYDYQSWMMAEVRALSRAVAHGRSTVGF